MRGTLNFENLGNVIPLKKELDLVYAYYQIEKERFENIHLEFNVEDNGAGIDKELLPELLSKPVNLKSIGLYSIHARLIRLYVKGLTICSTAGVGTVIQFEIPL